MSPLDDGGFLDWCREKLKIIEKVKHWEKMFTTFQCKQRNFVCEVFRRVVPSIASHFIGPELLIAIVSPLF
jgi:hypothetical protein